MNPSLMESMKEIPITQPEMIMMPNIMGLIHIRRLRLSMQSQGTFATTHLGAK